jgi:hypothetical protein
LKKYFQLLANAAQKCFTVASLVEIRIGSFSINLLALNIKVHYLLFFHSFNFLFLGEDFTPFIIEGRILSKHSSESVFEEGVSISDFHQIEGGKHTLLGKGAYGQVELVQYKDTKDLFALKKIDKRNLDSNTSIALMREIEIHHQLHHHNIIRLYAHFQDAKYVYFVNPQEARINKRFRFLN